MFDRELEGRVARAEISVFDAMMQEIYAERNKAKARRMRKPDNRTREERLSDWENKKDARKWHRFDRDLELYNRDWKARSDYMSHAERKICHAEKLARADWKLEQIAIAEDDERKAIEADIREWELRRAVEDANRRALIAMQNWLEWA